VAGHYIDSGEIVMSLLPREHGTYGQIAFPIVTAFGVAGLSAPGLLWACAVVAAFLAHEPAAILLGLRGPRARRERRDAAMRWLMACLAIGFVTGLWALATMEPAVRWSMAVPLAAALPVIVAAVRGREKSWHGEVAVSVACAGAAVPIAMAADASPATAAAVAIPFALQFVAGTLAVRVVIVRVRRGGDPRATAATRGAVLSLAGASTAALVFLTATGYLGPSLLAASAPGLLIATAVAIHPPSPAHLRHLGWSLVAASFLTAAIVVRMA
jgi:hypothetical protein